MKILIDIGHPAHVHLFREFAKDMMANGHSVFFTCRQKEFVVELLRYFKLPYKSIGISTASIPGKIIAIAKFGFKIYQISKVYDPDVFISHGSHYAAQVAFLLRKPHISLEDTFNKEQMWLYMPFSQAILTGDYENPLKSKKVVKYSGFHELAYLHPNRFSPNKKVLDELGISENEKYVIIRFVSWNASHDIGHSGISLDNKVTATKAFSEHAKVFITSEGSLPKELEQYKFPLSSKRMHHAMAFSSLIYGESATMVSEGAMLGVPGIYLDNKSRFYTKDLEKRYGLVWNFSESKGDQTRSIQKGVDLLSANGAKIIWQEKRRKMLDDKIDPTSFLCWFVENYPKSFRIMKENPDYQYNFK